MTSNLFRNYVIKRLVRSVKSSLICPYSSECSPTDSVSDLTITSPNTKENLSALDICKEDVSHYAPYLAPTYNIAAYANKSQTIQQLIRLGVDLSKIEKKGFTELILKCDFERDIKKYIQFLHSIGVPANEFGNFFTANPLIFKEDLDDLSVRINYLESKNFQPADIVRIVTKNPMWISHSSEDIDDRLGFFQDHFILSGDEVRHVAVRRPKLITYNLRHIETIKFTVQEEMGFTKSEIKQLLLKKPKIFSLNRIAVQQRLDYLLNTMKIPHEQITLQPSVLTARLEKVKQRHNFLALLKKNQYDPQQPGYISLESLVRGSDIEFCEKVAGTTVLTYNCYLKTL